MDKEERKKKIAIGADHAGFDLKEKIASYLRDKGFELLDYGTNSTESTDYPDYAYATAKSVSDNIADEGILVCGTGIGMSMVANKLPGVRAALCNSAETAKLAKEHNNANLLCLGSRIENSDPIEDIIDIWLETQFEAGRHEKRVEKIHTLTGI